MWLAYGVAGKLTLDPQSAIEIARVQIGRMRKAARGQALDVLDEWERLLAGPVDELLRSLVDASPRGRELRQNSPFAGVLDGDERERLLTSWRAHDRGDSR